MIRVLLQNLFDYERKETTGELIFYRCFELMIVYYTIKYAWRWGPYIDRLSDIVLPLGVAEYLDVSFMFAHKLGVVVAVLITGAVIAGFLRLSRYAYLVALLLFHVQYAARFSQGEISHGSNLVGMVVLSMAIATLAYKRRVEVRRTTLGLSYFFIGLSYVSAAICKLAATGLRWADGRHLWMWIQERTVDKMSLTGTIQLSRLQELTLQHYELATLFLAIGLVTESLAFLMWYKRFRPIIIPAVIGMHFGIAALMKITFSSNVYVLLILAFPVADLIDRFLIRSGSGMQQRLQSYGRLLG